RFRFRVHGSNAVARLGFDLTGKTIEDYPDSEYRRIVREHFGAAVQSRCPQRIVRDPYRIRDRVLRWEGLILPLAADGSTVDMLLVGLSVE
ncbi:MAG: PAS domain-containing protein, partial [Terriglobia bacterium]